MCVIFLSQSQLLRGRSQRYGSNFSSRMSKREEDEDQENDRIFKRLIIMIMKQAIHDQTAEKWEIH